MHKNELVLFLAMLLVCSRVWADVETTDKVVISELSVEPGGKSAYFDVSLQGSEVYYTAYEIDLYLPEGLNVEYRNGNPRVSMRKPSLYPYITTEEENEEGEFVEVKQYTHMFDFAVNENNRLKAIALSTKNENFTSVSGALFRVYVQASPYLKPGNADIKVSAKLVTADEVKHIPAEYISTSVKVGSTSTLGLKVSSTNQFGTCILPFDYVLPADGLLKAYTCNNHTEDALLLTSVAEKMEAYTPYILHCPNGFSATISGEVDASKYPEGGVVKQGFLVGTLVQKELTASTSYVMQNQGNGPLFYRVGATPFVLSAGKCYAELPEGSEARTIRFDDDATGIFETENEKLSGNQGTYDLSGRRVEKLEKGVYIVNGQKVVNW